MRLDPGDGAVAIAEAVGGDLEDPIADAGRGSRGEGAFEGECKVARGRESVFWATGHSFCDELVEVGGDEGIEGAWGGETAGEHAGDFGADLFGVEEASAGEGLPEHDAGCVDVGLAGRGDALELFGSEVIQLAFDLAVLRGLHAIGRSCHTEVHETGDTVGAHEHVLGRDVAVHEAERASFLVERFMRCVEPVEHADDDGDDAIERSGRADLAAALQEERQGLTAHEVHDEEQLAVHGDHVEHRHDVGVLHAGREAGLVDEHGHELGVVGELRVEPLDGDGPAETDGTGHAADMHGGHAAHGDGWEYDVASDDHSGGSAGGGSRRGMGGDGEFAGGRRPGMGR
ncbi:MAG TPA: hypothetical protein PLI95_24515, partial [Polyangiaceae bacterium]|nr:hypothetical protein [Polyangiaceae bacterium]